MSSAKDRLLEQLSRVQTGEGLKRKLVERLKGMTDAEAEAWANDLREVLDQLSPDYGLRVKEEGS